MLVLALSPALALAPGCASESGWRRTDARTCEPADPARVCVAAEPDQGALVRVGELALVPGECADAPAEHPRGVARVHVERGDGSASTRRLRLPRGRVTTLQLRAHARPRVHRERCTVTPGSDGSGAGEG